MEEKLFDIKVRYVFEGTYTVSAYNSEEAKAKAERDCGLVMGGHIHTTLDEGEVEWEFPLHPETAIISEKEQAGGWEEWWKKADSQTLEDITGYRQTDFSPEQGYQDFVNACNEYWNELPVLERKKIWKKHSPGTA